MVSNNCLIRKTEVYERERTVKMRGSVQEGLLTLRWSAVHHWIWTGVCLGTEVLPLKDKGERKPVDSIR